MASAAQIPLAMLLVFAAAKLLAELFERLGQPGIVGEILAGVLIGPHVLGWLAPSDFLGTLSDLGVMFLLFRVGLEVKAPELMKVGGTALMVAVAGVIVPFFAGWGICALWGEARLASIFTGAAMVATSVGITAQVLASRGLLDKRASRIILTAAVVDDVLGLIVLALVSGMAKGAVNYLGIALTAGMALGFTFLVARFGTRTVRRVMPRMQAGLRLAESGFAVAMTLLFALSLLAVYAGVAAIVGAFLAGMALSETAEGRVTVLTNGVAELLVPFFLVGIGLHFDVSAFASVRALALAGVLLVAAVVSKFAACGLGALRLGRTDAHPGGRRDGAARRGGDGGGADRAQPGGDRPQHLRDDCFHVGGDDADRAAAVEGSLWRADGDGEGDCAIGLKGGSSPTFGRMHKAEPYATWQVDRPGGLSYNSGVTKYIRYQSASGISYGTLEGDTVHEIEGGLFGTHTATGTTHKLSEVKLLYPCEPGKILAVGLNYRSHLGTRPQPAHPEMFYKPVSALQNPGDPIAIPRDATDVHSEGEMVVVVGKRLRNASAGEAGAAVFGVTCGNDVSERAWQSGAQKDLQWWRAKGSDTFAPLGPAIVSGVDYGKLLLQTRMNGETIQKQYTSDLIFDIEAVLSWISGWVTLLPGDLVYTGTPGNTRRMSPGDVIEVELDHVGVLRNPVS